ncbi:MAG: DUF4159 domain-containing protein [Gemmatimonadota bacterium]|nr:DUF4159 domain-containing protein [Gemmatimonadota bacterium]
MAARRKTWLGVALVLLVGVPLLLDGQGRFRGEQGGMDQLPNVDYDGRFTFVRIRYGGGDPGFGFGRGRGGSTWSHDYPRAEINFTKILGELSTVQTRDDGTAVLTLDDPALFNFPVAYLTEPGHWVPSEPEIVGFRNYVLKGGFMILDDFDGRDWINMEEQMRRVLPEARLQLIPNAHPVFDSFYRIDNFDGYIHPYSQAQSEFWGVFEDNDPTKRLMVAICYQADIAEYWEFSDQGYFPIDLSNESYKLGVNYMVYALTR